MFRVVRTETTQRVKQFRGHSLRLTVSLPAMNNTVAYAVYGSSAEVLLKPVHQHGRSRTVIRSFNGVSLRFLSRFLNDQYRLRPANALDFSGKKTFRLVARRIKRELDARRAPVQRKHASRAGFSAR